MNEYATSLFLGIVEGVTEFLPISSTGHLILANEFLHFKGHFAVLFDIVIQLGAVLSVVVYFWEKLSPFGKPPDESRMIFSLWGKTLIAVMPALLLGAAFGNIVEEKLFNPFVVSLTLLLGGIVLIFLEIKEKRIDDVASLSFRTALSIGMIQCLAMIPGTSRSAATIIGAMLLGASRAVAAEFSFFLAIPTMVAASSYSLLKTGLIMTPKEVHLLFIGFVTSFVVALLVISVFMRYISSNGFKPFGYYRIALGSLVLLYFLR